LEDILHRLPRRLAVGVIGGDVYPARTPKLTALRKTHRNAEQGKKKDPPYWIWRGVLVCPCVHGIPRPLVALTGVFRVVKFGWLVRTHGALVELNTVKFVHLRGADGVSNTLCQRIWPKRSTTVDKKMIYDRSKNSRRARPRHGPLRPNVMVEGKLGPEVGLETFAL
jgi:hypothetical protein